MRFSVDAWDPAYGTSVDPGELAGSDAAVDPGVELPAAEWRPLPAPAVPLPSAVHFVDGVRRVDLVRDGDHRFLG